MVRDRSAWGFGYHTPNRKAIEAGDKVLFYLTGTGNQVFVGAATLKSGAYKDETGESADWYLDGETLRIDLQDVVVFAEPKLRKDFQSLEWRPAQGGSSKISEKDYQIVMGLQGDIVSLVHDTEEEMEFALEKYLEDFIISNWDKIDFGKKLEVYQDDNGNTGQQYYTGDVGYIDILARDAEGSFVVIELKKGRKNDEVVGQVLRYMGWVRENLAKPGEKVQGMIVVKDKDPKLEYALKEISDRVSIKRYNVSFKLVSY